MLVVSCFDIVLYITTSDGCEEVDQRLDLQLQTLYMQLYK